MTSDDEELADIIPLQEEIEDRSGLVISHLHPAIFSHSYCSPQAETRTIWAQQEIQSAPIWIVDFDISPWWLSITYSLALTSESFHMFRYFIFRVLCDDWRVTTIIYLETKFIDQQLFNPHLDLHPIARSTIEDDNIEIVLCTIALTQWMSVGIYEAVLAEWKERTRLWAGFVNHINGWVHHHDSIMNSGQILD